jgi:hypothetical protein
VKDAIARLRFDQWVLILSLSGFSANFHTPGLNQPVRLPP